MKTIVGILSVMIIGLIGYAAYMSIQFGSATEEIKDVRKIALMDRHKLDSLYSYVVIKDSMYESQLDSVYREIEVLSKKRDEALSRAKYFESLVLKVKQRVDSLGKNLLDW